MVGQSPVVDKPTLCLPQGFYSTAHHRLVARAFLEAEGSSTLVLWCTLALGRSSFPWSDTELWDYSSLLPLTSML